MIFDTPLNEAHQLDRAAENHLRFKRFDQSLECHEKAKEKLTEALTLSTNPRIVESLELQRAAHTRKQRLIKMKKDDYIAKLKKEEKEVPINTLNKKEILDNRTQPIQALKTAIFKNFEEADSLLKLLLPKGDGKSVVSKMGSSNSSWSEDQSQSQNQGSSSKLPKNPIHVIEELNTVNHELRVRVKQLVEQVEEKTRENETKQIVIWSLESELREYRLLEAQRATRRPPHGHQMADSAAVDNKYSPYVSPSGQLSPQIDYDDDHHVTRTLPALPPLEMPDFDYSLLSKQN